MPVSSALRRTYTPTLRLPAASLRMEVATISRASAFMVVGTASSRSRITPSAPAATALSGQPSLWPGTKRMERMGRMGKVLGCLAVFGWLK